MAPVPYPTKTRKLHIYASIFIGGVPLLIICQCSAVLNVERLAVFTRVYAVMRAYSPLTYQVYRSDIFTLA